MAAIVCLLLGSVGVGAPAAEEKAIPVPGGAGFVRSVLGMAPDGAGDELLFAVADHLERPRVVDLVDRLDRFVGELGALEGLLAKLGNRFGSAAARWGEEGSPGHERAEAILDHFGIRPLRRDGDVDFEYTGGERASHRRELLSHLGVSVPRAARRWLAGEPIELEIPGGSVSLPHGVDAWRGLLGEPVDRGDLFVELLKDSRIRSLLRGIGSLDRGTRRYVLETIGLEPLHRSDGIAATFARMAPYLRVRERSSSTVVTSPPTGAEADRSEVAGSAAPGGPPSVRIPGGERDVWEAILGAWDGFDGLLRQLADRPVGAHLWRAASLIPEGRARYLLTMGRDDPDERAAWGRRLRDSVSVPEFGERLSWPYDVAELFLELRLDEGGRSVDWPGGAEAWLAAVGRRTAPTDGRDAAILSSLVGGAEPGSDDNTIAAFLTTARALRYQPRETIRTAVPDLYREHDRFGSAYRFLVVPEPLSPATVLAFVDHLREVDGIGRRRARIETIRQLQATLMITRRLILNGHLRSADRREVLDELFGLEIGDELGYGPRLSRWWRERLLPAVGRALVEAGWEGEAGDLDELLFAGLVGAIPVRSLEVDGVPYRYAPARKQGRRIMTHLTRQRVPSLVRLLEIDRLAARAGRADASRETRETLAGALERSLGELRFRVPPSVQGGGADEALPVPVPRPELVDRGDRLVQALRGGTTEASSSTSGSCPGGGVEELAMAVRRALTGWLGDALVGLVYATHMGDPEAYVFKERMLSWLHVVEPLEDPGADGWGAWKRTTSGTDPRQGIYFRNSLFGLPGRLATLQLGQRLFQGGGGSGGSPAQQTWGRVLGELHTPSLREEALQLVERRARLGDAWVLAAARREDPRIDPAAIGPEELKDVPPSPLATTAAEAGAGPPSGGGDGGTLAKVARYLLSPRDWQALVDAVGRGRGAAALEVLTPGDLYLLGRRLEGEDRGSEPRVRWFVDQAVGMPLGRWGSYLGLGHPPIVPHEEARAAAGDPRAYARVLDVRVALAAEIRAQGWPVSLHGPLLARAMADTLAAAGSDEPMPRRLARIAAERVDSGTVRDWVVDMAFADEFVPEEQLAARGGAPEETGDVGPGSGRRRVRSGLERGLELPVESTAIQGMRGDDQRPAYEARVETVLVDVGVWDEAGRFVTGLGSDDFTVRQDGVEVEPDFVRLEGSPGASSSLPPLSSAVVERVEPRPRNVVLVADLLNTPAPAWERIVDETIDFVREGLASRDRIALVEIPSSGGIRLVNGFTDDRRAIVRGLEGLEGSRLQDGQTEDLVRELGEILCDNGGCEGFCPPTAGPGGDPSCSQVQTTGRFSGCATECEGWEESKIRRAQGRVQQIGRAAGRTARTALRSLTELAAGLSAAGSGRQPKTVVLLSGGFESQPGRAYRQTLVDYAVQAGLDNLAPQLSGGSSGTTAEIDRVARLMQACRCTVYSIDPLGLRGVSGVDVGGRWTSVVSAGDLRSARRGPLDAIAEETGGQAFFGSDAAQGFRRVVEDSRLRYVIGFQVARVGDEPEAADGRPRWHGIEVRTGRSGLTVRAREGFYWPPGQP